MITKTTAFVDTNYRECDYDDTEFCHIKEMFRENGLVENEGTLLCGKRQYTNIENRMLPWIREYDSEKNVTNCKYFMHLGITWKLMYVEGLKEWSMIVLTTQADI